MTTKLYLTSGRIVEVEIITKKMLPSKELARMVKCEINASGMIDKVKRAEVHL